jgi:hypothetical protein
MDLILKWINTSYKDFIFFKLTSIQLVANCKLFFQWGKFTGYDSEGW